MLTGRCWMAEGFPMSLRQLLPILDIIGTANKHLARVAKFMQKYADMELFPVKLQVRPAPYVKAVKVGMGPCTLPDSRSNVLSHQHVRAF